jgi:DNA-binding protein YbaB
MFSKLKQYKDMRSQAKTMQNVLAQETINVEKNGNRAVINGNMEITSLSLNDSLSKESLENSIKDMLNDGIKKAQRLMAEKIQSMGGLDQFKV